MEKLTESLEKYLVNIYSIVKQNSAARVKDVSSKMNVGIASTSEAVKTLAKKGMINYKPYGIITITDVGTKVAEDKIKRHDIICDFLKNVLLMSDSTIESAADNMEYSMTEEVLDRFLFFMSFMNKCTCKEPKWVSGCHHYMYNGDMQGNCADCAKNKNTSASGGCGCGGCK